MTALAACQLCFLELGCQLQFGVHDTPHAGPTLETLARLETPPTTIALAPDGHLFVSFPNWWSQPPIAVAAIDAQKLSRGASDVDLEPYPDAAWNQWNGEPGAAAAKSFVCVQAVHIDRCGASLWVVDAGNPLRLSSGVVPGAPKLVQIDLASGEVMHVFAFDDAVAPEDSYLNDVAVDMRTKTAYLTDSGLGAIVVVDLASGKARRVLADDPSTKAEDHVVPIVGGQAWRTAVGTAPRVHVDGLALGPDGRHLYYHALTARTLYRVRTDALRDARLDEAALAKNVEALGKTSAVDGMWMDADGSLYLTAIEHDAIERRLPDGALETVVADGLIQWPDAVLVGAVDGQRYVYWSASQIHKGRPFNGGIDTRTTPFEIFRAAMVATGLPAVPARAACQSVDGRR